MNPDSSILFDQAPVHAIARRRGFISRNAAVLTGGALLLGAILVFACLDGKLGLPESTRVWLIGLAGAAALTVFVQRWLAGRKGQDAQRVVRDMEAANPAVGQQLRTAWEISTKGLPASATEEQRAFSARLLSGAQAHVHGGKWEALAPAGRMVRWLAVCAAIAVAMFIVALQWPDFRLALRRVIMPLGAPTYTTVAWESPAAIYDDRHPPRVAVSLAGRQAEPQLQVLESGATEWQTRPLNALADGSTYDAVLTGMTGDFQARVTAGDGTTPLHLVKYRPIPRLEEAKVTIHFPEYTGLEPEERQGADASVVEGSTLGWAFQFNTPPDRVEWTLASGTSTPQALPLQAEGSTVRASWKTPPGRYAGVLTIYDGDGAVMDSWRYEIVGAVDKLPTVELLEPVKDVQATSVTELPVRIRARDDFGVAEIGLIMEAAGQTIWTLEKVIDEKDQRDISELTRAMLETVPLTIRDNVKLYAYALDHKPRGGPRGVSPLRSIDIRDFKRYDIYLAKGKKPPIKKQEFTKLNALIRAQRVVVSDCHVLKEEARDEMAEGIGTRCEETVVKQQETLAKTKELHDAWVQEPSIPRDDVALLGTAAAQMDETSRYLTRKLTEQAHPASDRALGSLLQIRKHLMGLIGPQCDCDSDADLDLELKSLEELAKEAERLAEEEKSVHAQITPGETKHVAPLASSRRQQEVAVADGGELFSEIVAHPKKNEPMLKLMAAAEKAMREADERLHSTDHLTAQPPLAEAEHELRDLSAFIRAMIEEKLAETLKQLASKAESDAKKSKVEGQGKGAGQGEGDSKESGPPGKGKSGKGQGEGESGQEMAANKEQRGKGNKKGEQAAQEAARNAKLADEILKELQALASSGGDKESEGPGENGKKPGPGPGSGSGMSAADLAALRKRADTEALAKELQKLAQQGGLGNMPGNGEKGKDGKGDKPGEGNTPGEGKGTGPGGADKPVAAGGSGTGAGKDPGTENGDGAGKDIAARLGKMAKELNAEAARLNASRLAHLAEVREKARALRDKAAQEQAAAQAEADKQLIAQLLARGMQPGQKVNVNGRTITIPESAAPGSGAGAGTGEGEGKERKPGPGSPKADIERFAAEAQRLGDDTVTGLAKQLETDIPLVTAFDGIIERLDLLMAALPGNATPQTVQARVPESHRREIEAYFRNLSDDFGNESK
jgi:hypothetical protein